MASANSIGRSITSNRQSQGGSVSKVLDETVENLEFIKEAINHYELALKSAFPVGASGHVFHHWNEARKFLRWVGSKPTSITKTKGEVND